MNIALITNEFYPTHGGVAQHLNSLCKSFQQTGHTLYVFNRLYRNGKIFDILDRKKYSKISLFEFFKEKDMINTLLHSIKIIASIKKVSFLARLKMMIYLLSNPELLIKTTKNLNILYPYFKDLKIDLILGGSTFAPILTLIVILSQIFNKKLIAITHGNDYLTRKPFYLKTPYFRCLNKLVITSKRNENNVKMIHNLSDEKLRIIHLGLILKDYDVKKTKKELREKWNIPMDDFIILCVGRHEPRKKFDMVIKALYELKKKVENIKIRCISIGTGETTSKLKELTKKLKLEENVAFLGACSEETRNEFYKLSDIFIMPSIMIKKTRSIEGFGIVFLEANYHKLPVIGASTGGIVDAIENGHNGLLVKPNNLADLVEKILYLYKNEEIRIKMGEIGHKRVVTSFNWDNILREYIKLFKEVINQIN